MPLVAMASAIARTSAAVILPAKWFQLFQPIGGVMARPLAGTGATAAGAAASLAPTNPVAEAAMAARKVATTRRARGRGTAAALGAKRSMVNGIGAGIR